MKTGNQKATPNGKQITKGITNNAATGAVGSVAPAISKALTNTSGTGEVGSLSSGATDLTLSLTSVSSSGTVNGFPFGAYVEEGYGHPDYYEYMGVNFRLPASGVSGTGQVGSMVATVYDDVVITLTAIQAKRLEAVLRLHGLIDPLVVTPTSRGDGTVTQTLSGTGPVTVTTNSLPAFGAPTPARLDDLARWYGLIDPMIEQDASRSDGTLSQSVVTSGTTTTVTTL